jgi:hypothetical protein
MKKARYMLKSHAFPFITLPKKGYTKVLVTHAPFGSNYIMHPAALAPGITQTREAQMV